MWETLERGRLTATKLAWRLDSYFLRLEPSCNPTLLLPQLLVLSLAMRACARAIQRQAFGARSPFLRRKLSVAPPLRRHASTSKSNANGLTVIDHHYEYVSVNLVLGVQARVPLAKSITVLLSWVQVAPAFGLPWASPKLA